MRQPLNVLAPFVVNTDSGPVSIDDNGLEAQNVIVTKLKFSDGSLMVSAGSGLPSDIDSGTF